MHTMHKQNKINKNYYVRSQPKQLSGVSRLFHYSSLMLVRFVQL